MQRDQTHLHRRLSLPLPVTAAQQAEPVRPQFTAHVPAAGHRLTGNDAPCRLLIGCLEDRDPGVDLAQARTGHDQHAIGQQRAQPGGMSVEGRALGAGHGGDEVIARRVQEQDPFAHTPILPSQHLATHGHRAAGAPMAPASNGGQRLPYGTDHLAPTKQPQASAVACGPEVPPGRRRWPDYHASYCRSVRPRPDGNNVEAVGHRPEQITRRPAIGSRQRARQLGGRGHGKCCCPVRDRRAG